MKEQKIKNKILFFSGLNFPQSIFHNFRDDVTISNILIILNTSGFGHTLCSVILNITLFIIKVQHKCHGQTQWFILEMKSIKQKFPFRAGIQFMLKNKCDYVINNLKKSNICKIYTVDIFKYSYFILSRLNNSFEPEVQKITLDLRNMDIATMRTVLIDICCSPAVMVLLSFSLFPLLFTIRLYTYISSTRWWVQYLC